MPACPACKQDFEKRKNDTCPGCGTPVQAYGGYWYRTDLGSPSEALLKHLCSRISRQLSISSVSPVVFTVSKKTPRYKREMVAAERLLVETDGDFDLAKETIDILFDDSRFNWKLRDTLMYIAKDFTTALAVARSNRAIKEKEVSAQQAYLARLAQKEDLFS